MGSITDIRTGLDASEIKQDFRENLRCGLGRADRFATRSDHYYALAIRDYCDRMWNIKPAGTPS